MDDIPDESKFIMGCVGIVAIVAVLIFSHEQGYQEEFNPVQHNPKYDAKAQIAHACERFTGQ